MLTKPIHCDSLIFADEHSADAIVSPVSPLDRLLNILPLLPLLRVRAH